VLSFAAPLFRLALTAYLDLRFVPEFPNATDGGLGELAAKGLEFRGPQRDCEAAILSAEAGPQIRRTITPSS